MSSSMDVEASFTDAILTDKRDELLNAVCDLHEVRSRTFSSTDTDKFNRASQYYDNLTKAKSKRDELYSVITEAAWQQQCLLTIIGHFAAQEVRPE